MTKPAKKISTPTTTHKSNPHAAAQRAELDALIEKIRDKVLENPGKAAILLKDWIQSPKKSVSNDKSSTSQNIRKKAA